MLRVRKRAKLRNLYNQAPHLTQDTNGKVITTQLNITNESQKVSLFPAGEMEENCTHNPEDWNNKSIKGKCGETFKGRQAAQIALTEPYLLNMQYAIK